VNDDFSWRDHERLVRFGPGVVGEAPDLLAARDGASLDWLEPVLGLDPLIERGGEQLTMFGE